MSQHVACPPAMPVLIELADAKRRLTSLGLGAPASLLAAKPAVLMQALVDDISAAVYNVVFTSVPILLFAVLDRPVMRLDTLLRFPQVRRPAPSLLIVPCAPDMGEVLLQHKV